jgi:hypothetical protein
MFALEGCFADADYTDAYFRPVVFFDPAGESSFEVRRFLAWSFRNTFFLLEEI